MPFDSYLKIEGIDGESTAKGYESWIQVLDFRSRIAQQGGGSASGSSTHSGGSAEFSPIIVSKLVDKSSPKLSQYCASATQVGTVTLVVCKSAGGKEKFIEYKLSRAVVASLDVDGAPTKADKPSEHVGFRFDKIEWTYTPFDGDKKQGDVKTGWDVSKDTKV